MRTFISVELPDEVKKNVVELISELDDSGANVKWVKAENLHMTLKFLGWVEDKNLDKLIELATKAVAGSGSFKAKFFGVGIFSSRVVWAGTAEGGGKLCDLAKNLEEVLAKAGFRSEAREFKPHLTIGRVRIKDKKGIDKLIKKIESNKNAEFGEALVDRIYIMKSTLTRAGPIYEKYKEVKL